MTPIIFHDENGFEVYVNNEIVSNETNKPTTNLEVNGAGDMFAAIFIQNHFKHNIHHSAKIAMLKTTEYLIDRNKNE